MRLTDAAWQRELRHDFRRLLETTPVGDDEALAAVMVEGGWWTEAGGRVGGEPQALIAAAELGRCGWPARPLRWWSAGILLAALPSTMLPVELRRLAAHQPSRLRLGPDGGARSEAPEARLLTYDVAANAVCDNRRPLCAGDKAWRAWRFARRVYIRSLCAYLVGLAQGSVNSAIAYAGRRVQFGRPLLEFQAVGHRLAAIDAELRALRFAIADLAGHGPDDDAALTDVAAWIVEACTTAHETAVHVYGAAGLLLAGPLANRCDLAASASAVLTAAAGQPETHQPLALATPDLLDIHVDGQRHHQQAVPDWWTRNAMPLRRDCVHELFRQQACRTPAATALEFFDDRVTYAELDAMSERIARHLVAAGTVSQDLVGICMTRSIEMIAAVLGVLKAGAAYVPLDPDYPADRLAHIAREAQLQLVLAQQWSADLLDHDGLRTLLVDDCLASDDPPVVVPPAMPHHTAYVLFTSGSTGEPKGVAVEHRSLTNRVLWDAATFPLTSADAVVQHTSLSFDISVCEIFPALVQGARVVLAKPSGAADPGYFGTLIANHHVTVVSLVPSMLDALTEEEPGLRACPSLRYVFCGGEALPQRLVERTLGQTDAALYNFYGPTECTVDATYCQCGPQSQTATAPIGRPIGNAVVRLLDEHGTDVPPGVAGEIYVGGAVLARGYWNRPEETQRRFVWLGDSPERFYRTGDLARWSTVGVLEFLGRLDDQIKINGYRVEPAEVEVAVAAYPGVREVSVFASGGRLIAAVVPGDAALDTQQLRQQVAQRLPRFMVPSRFLVVDQLPRLPTGKIDRRGLLDLGADTERHTVPDHADIDVKGRIEAFAGNLLGTDIDPLEDFFAAGGTSLHAMRLVSRCRREFRVAIELQDFIRRPSLSALMQLVMTRMSQGQEEPFDTSGDNPENTA